MEAINLLPLHRKILFICLSLATFMIVLDYSIANISIPYIAGDLSVSVDQGTYVITSFAVGNSIGLAVTGWLSKKFGQIRLICASLILFTFFSWSCGLSVSLQMLVISRFLQGLVSGPMIPLSQSLIISTGTPEKRTRNLAIWLTIVVAAPVLGPIFGAYISEYYYWPWIFYINIPVGIISVIGIWFVMKTHEYPIEKAPTDIPGFILLALGVTALQILLDKGQQWDWLNSNLIRILLIITVVAFTLLIIREIYHDTPFLELRLMAIPSFAVSIICLAVSYGIYFGAVVLVPLWLQQYMGYDAVSAGLAVCTLGIGPILFSVFVPKLIKLLGFMPILLFSFVIFAGSSFYTAYFTTQIDIYTIAFSRFLFGFALVFWFNPLVALSIQNIPVDNLPSATSLFHFVRAMFGGIGTSVFTTLLQRRTIFHHERVGSFLTPFNPVTPQHLNDQGLALLNQSLDVESSMLSMNDAFFLMGWLFVGLIVLLCAYWIWKRPSQQIITVTSASE